MSQPSDRPAPRFGPRPHGQGAVQDAIYRRIAQESADAINVAIEELELRLEDRQYCDWLVTALREMLALRSTLAERDMEIERLRADLEGLRDQCRIIWWPRSNVMCYPIEHNMAARVDMFDVILAEVRAARAASRDEERDHHG